MRTLRQRQNMSQADLARALGASINAINMIECGQVKAPHIERLMAMADLFDVSLDYLVGMTDDPTPAARRRPPTGGSDLGLTVVPAVVRHHASPARVRQGGAWAGKVWIAPDFDDTDEELIRLFEGEEDDAAPR